MIKGSLFLCADPCRGNMPLGRRTGRAASREDGSSLLDCADPCRGNMPLRRTKLFRGHPAKKEVTSR